MNKNKKEKFGTYFASEKVNGGYILSGYPLDGVKLEIFTEAMINDIKGIVCYNYEDDESDNNDSCVMEIIFCNSHEEFSFDGMRLRLLYCNPSELLYELGLMHLCATGLFSFIKMDIYGSHHWCCAEDCVDLKDFEKFGNEIIHKKRFYLDNPIIKNSWE